MKKTILCFALCAALSAATLCGAAALLNTQKNAVTNEETIFFGDRVAAEGLSIERNLALRYDTDSNGTTWWALQQVYTTDALVFTPRFAFQHRPYTRMYYTPRGLTLQTLGAYQSRYERDQEQALLSDTLYCAEEHKLMSYLADGETKGSFRADLADYYRHLPLWFEWETTVDYTHGRDTPTTNDACYALYQTLNEQLRIPVSPDSYVTVHFEADSQFRYQSARVDAYFPENSGFSTDCQIDTVSVCTENGVYFAISPQYANSTHRLDLSELALGYGIYYVPFQTANGEQLPDAAGLRRVIALDPDDFDRFHRLVWNEERERLYLTASRDEQYSLLCFDCIPYHEFDRISLMARPAVIHYGAKYLYIDYDGGAQDLTFSVYAEKANGYEECFTQESHFSAAHLMDDDTVQTAFDGERLAIVSQRCGYYEEFPLEGSIDTSGLCVAIYDQRGLLFHAHNSISLHGAGFACAFPNGRTIDVRWET